MFSFFGNNQDRPKLLHLLLKRCDAIISLAEKNSKEDHQIAERWGKTHIILGISTILCSSISTVFAFSSVQTLVITSSLLSTILASCITFLNPSQREIKRRNSSNKFLSFVQNVEQTKLSLNVKGMKKEDMIGKVEDLNKQLEALISETFRNN